MSHPTTPSYLADLTAEEMREQLTGEPRRPSLQAGAETRDQNGLTGEWRSSRPAGEDDWTSPVTIAEVKAAAAETMAANDWINACYYQLSFGEVVVVRSGECYLASEYDAGQVGPHRG